MVAERTEDLDVIGIAERRARGRGAGVLRAPGPGGRPQGLRRRQGRGPRPGRELVGRVLEGLYAEPPPLGVPKQVLVPDEPDDLDALRASGSRELRGSRGRRSGCRSGATSGRCRRRSPATPRRSSSATGCGGPSDHNSRARALNELQDAPRPARGPAAHRVLRHEPHPGHRLRRLDGGDGGRPAQEERVPPVQGQATVAGNDDFAAMEEVLTRRLTALPGRARPAGGRAAAASSPTRRSCCWSTAARASSAWPCGCSRSSGLDDEIPVAVAGQAVRGGLRARPGRPDPHPPPVRGAVPAAADPRRGPPLRHHLPPPAAGQAHDHVACSTTSPASGPTRKKRLVKELGGVQGGEGGVARRAAGAAVAARRGRPRRCTRRSTAPSLRGAHRR